MSRGNYHKQNQQQRQTHEALPDPTCASTRQELSSVPVHVTATPRALSSTLTSIDECKPIAKIKSVANGANKIPGSSIFPHTTIGGKLFREKQSTRATGSIEIELIIRVSPLSLRSASTNSPKSGCAHLSNALAFANSHRSYNVLSVGASKLARQIANPVPARSSIQSAHGAYYIIKKELVSVLIWLFF